MPQQAAGMPMQLPNTREIIWELGSTYVEAFMNPASHFCYLRQSGTDTCVILNIMDFANIVAAISKRAMKTKANAPTGDELPF